MLQLPNKDISKKHFLNIPEIKELYTLHDSLQYKDFIKKCIYIIYSLQKIVSTHWISRLPPYFLMYILSKYIVDRFSVGKYYSVIDNSNTTYSFNEIKSISERKRFIKRGRYYIGKILNKKYTQNGPMYLITYKDWDTCFDEWVSKKQLFHMKQNYLHTIDVNQYVDCLCDTNNKWYGGIITKVHFRYPDEELSSRKLTNCIEYIDIISYYIEKKNFIYRRRIPLYSNCFAKFNTHTKKTINTARKYLLLNALEHLKVLLQSNVVNNNYIEFKGPIHITCSKTIQY